MYSFPPLRVLARAFSLVRRRSKKGSAQSVEFILAIFVLLLLITFPLIDLLGLACSAGMLCLLTHQIATRASQQATYPGALNAMTTECSNLMNTGFAKFLNLQATSGYQNSGSDLYIYSTPQGGGPNSTVTIGPDTPLTVPPTPATNVYEYMALTNFTVKPLIPMTGMPWLQNVPALGQPVQITWTASRAAEFVDGLSVTVPGGGNSTVTLPQLDTLAGADPTPTFLGNGSSPYGWRNPGIYSSPTMLGKTVMNADVLLVPANAKTYVTSSFSVGTGSSVWVDTHADGLWAGGSAPPGNDANGIFNLTGPANINGRVFGNYSGGGTSGTPIFPPCWTELVGVVSSSPPNIVSNPTLFVPLSPYPTSTPGFCVLADNSATPSPGSGPLNLLINDDFRPDNIGAQAVRVIIYR